MGSDLWLLLRQQNQELGALIRETRRRALMSQSELIKHLGYPPHMDVPSLSRWEAGTMMPPPHIAERLTYWLEQEAQREALQAILTPHTRSSDPDTSHAAARSVTSKTLRDLHRWWLRHLADQWKHDPDQLNIAGFPIGYLLTDEGARTIYHGLASESGFRTRRAELRHAGLVEDSGKRYPISTGRLAIAWRLTPSGYQALQETP